MTAKLHVRFPAAEPIDTSALLAMMTDAHQRSGLTVGDPRVLDFLSGFASRLLQPAVVRRFPELAPLGFFLRKAALPKALTALHATVPDQALIMPRGLVFHIPPANVDTIFAYSWALSALAGNANLVRISERSAGAATAILDALDATDADPVLRATQMMVTYDRDDAVTAQLSAASDLRVIWGGDDAVSNIRRIPLPPSARDLTFPDRTSFAVISIPGWRTATNTDRAAVANGLVNDVYWFDQAACSSPRTFFLVGDASEFDEVHAHILASVDDALRIRAFPPLDPSMNVEKRVRAYGLAADGLIDRMAFYDTALTDMRLTDPRNRPRRWVGPGVFAFAHLSTLAQLPPLIARRDQTMTTFGFSNRELNALARTIGGRGVDRIVPIGQALSFSGIWDGYDLMREFTRLVTITA